jgi:hypothetical protein
MDSDGSNLKQLTDSDEASGELEAGPTWSPDGNKIVFGAMVDGNGDIYVLELERNTPPIVTVDQVLVSVDEGQTVINGGAVNDPDGDQVTLSASVGTVINDGDETWSWSFATSDGPAESQTVTISADDDHGGTSQATFELTVDNVAPTVGAITATVDPVQVGAEISISADFTDPGMLDTHIAEWDWGDTSTSVGTVNETNGSGSVSGNHTYTDPGVYTIRLTVTDKDGGIGESVFQFVVVFDPDGGFVTGGGWIDSPQGAYTPDPSLTGKANFGFVSKYKKGATVPTGQTEFQFQVADLNFHSGSYDWLVVAGPKAQFKGTGTINGMGNFGFMLTAIDEALTPSTEVDLFRIKIWDKDNDDTIIYDNQMGDDDDVDPATAIGGGSIVIHKAK